jgi:hypothetical protein
MDSLDQRGPDTDDETFTRFKFKEGMARSNANFSEEQGERQNEPGSLEERKAVVWKVFEEIGRLMKYPQFSIESDRSLVLIWEKAMFESGLVLGGNPDVLADYIRQAVVLAEKGNMGVSEDQLEAFLQSEEATAQPKNLALYEFLNYTVAKAYTWNREVHAEHELDNLPHGEGRENLYTEFAANAVPFDRGVGKDLNEQYEYGARMTELIERVVEYGEAEARACVKRVLEEGLVRVARKYLVGTAVDYQAPSNDVAQQGDRRAMDQALTWLLTSSDNVAEIYEMARGSDFVLEMAQVGPRFLEDPFLMERIIESVLQERQTGKARPFSDVEHALLALLKDIIKKAGQLG